VPELAAEALDPGGRITFGQHLRVQGQVAARGRFEAKRHAEEVELLEVAARQLEDQALEHQGRQPPHLPGLAARAAPCLDQAAGEPPGVTATREERRAQLLEPREGPDLGMEVRAQVARQEPRRPFARGPRPSTVGSCLQSY
jgi:hypothetical protein